MKDDCVTNVQCRVNKPKRSKKHAPITGLVGSALRALLVASEKWPSSTLAKPIAPKMHTTGVNVKINRTMTPAKYAPNAA